MILVTSVPVYALKALAVERSLVLDRAVMARAPRRPYRIDDMKNMEFVRRVEANGLVRVWRVR